MGKIRRSELETAEREEKSREEKLTLRDDVVTKKVDDSDNDSVHELPAAVDWSRKGQLNARSQAMSIHRRDQLNCLLDGLTGESGNVFRERPLSIPCRYDERVLRVASFHEQSACFLGGVFVLLTL